MHTMLQRKVELPRGDIQHRTPAIAAQSHTGKEGVATAISVRHPP